MNDQHNLGGSFTFAGSNLTVSRMGYGAMKLAGPMVSGPPRDKEAAVTILREAVAAGVNHIDTADFYGPHVTNQIIKEALYPYPESLVLVTKVGIKRGADKSWNPAFSKQEITEGVHDNLRNLGLERLPIVNLRARTADVDHKESLEEPWTALAELQQQGLIQHLGVSGIVPEQLPKLQAIAPVVCVQNVFNIADRLDDPFLDDLNRQGIAYVPFFPLGGFKPLKAAALDTIAASLGATSMQVALAWLLHRSPNLLLIPGTSSVAHLRENLDAAWLILSADVQDQLDSLAGEIRWKALHR